jgi:CRISPR-associated exonuclease Cas4
MASQYITATDLMNYSYCPRIIYYMHVLKDPQFTTKKEFKGREKEDQFRPNAKRTKVVKELPPLPKKFKVSLVSEELGIKTIADSIIINKSKSEAYPLQIKYSFRPDILYKTQKNQLFMEALLIEKQLNYRVPFGFIKFLRSGDVVKQSMKDKNKVIPIFTNIRKIIEKERFPEPTKHLNHCTDCCYNRKCWGEYG